MTWEYGDYLQVKGKAFFGYHSGNTKRKNYIRFHDLETNKINVYHINRLRNLTKELIYINVNQLSIKEKLND